MKKLLQTIFATLVVMLVGVQIADFYYAPRTAVGVAKAWVGKSILLREYASSTAAQKEEFCDRIYTRIGYSYTCNISQSVVYITGEQPYQTVDLYLSAYENRHDAQLNDFGGRFYVVDQCTRGTAENEDCGYYYRPEFHDYRLSTVPFSFWSVEVNRSPYPYPQSVSVFDG